MPLPVREARERDVVGRQSGADFAWSSRLPSIAKSRRRTPLPRTTIAARPWKSGAMRRTLPDGSPRRSAIHDHLGVELESRPAAVARVRRGAGAEQQRRQPPRRPATPASAPATTTSMPIGANSRRAERDPHVMAARRRCPGQMEIELVRLLGLVGAEGIDVGDRQAVDRGAELRRDAATSRIATFTVPADDAVARRAD